MAARRYSKKKKSTPPPPPSEGLAESVWSYNSQVWADYWDTTGGDFIASLRAATPAGDAWAGLGSGASQALPTSPAASQILSQIQPLSDFQPHRRQEYDQFWRRWRATVINDYNELGRRLSPSSKQAALANAWAEGVTGLSFLLRNQSDPDPQHKDIPPSLLRSIEQDFGGKENFIGWEQLGSSSMTDAVIDFLYRISNPIFSMKDAFWAVVNGIKTWVGSGIDSMASWLSSIWSSIMQVGSDMWFQVGIYISEVAHDVFTLGYRISDAIERYIVSLRNQIVAAFYELQVIIANNIMSLIDNLSSFFHALRVDLVGAFDRARAEISIQLNYLVNSLYDASRQVWSQISQTMLEVPAMAWNIINEAKASISAALDSQLAGSMYGSFQSARSSMTQFVSSGYGMLEQFLRSQAPITPANIPSVAAGTVTMAAGFGLAAHLSSAFFELAHPLKELGLHQISAFLSQMAGFGGITAATMGIMTGIALRQPMQYYANDIFRPRVPGEGVLIDMATKPDISLEDFQKYFGWYGYSDQWIARTVKTMYKEPGHRELLLMSEDSPIDEKWLLTKIMRAGYEVPDAERLVTGVMARNESTERRMIFSALGRLYKEGYINSTDFANQIAPLGMREENIALVMKAMDLNYAFDRTNDLVRLYADEFQKEILTESDLRVAYSALGIIWEKADYLVAKAKIRKLPRPTHPEKAENARSIAELQKRYSALYIDQFRKELITAVELRQNLESIGIDADLASVATQQEITKRLPIPSVVATRTSERADREVTKLYTSLYRDQFRKGLLDQEQLLSHFVSLGIAPEKAEVMVDLEIIRAYSPPPVETA